VILGVPLALVLATLTFLGGFIPIVGAFVAGALAVLVALVANGLTTALIVLAIILAVQQLEGNVLQPILQSRSMNLHPAIVLLAVTGGSSLFGIIGAFLAVPAAAVAAVLIRYVSEQIDERSNEPDQDELEDQMPAPEGLTDEQAGLEDDDEDDKQDDKAAPGKK
jgi:predicted PurR-regulated permease PerM